MKFLKLARGSHRAGSGQGCAMEAVAALNGELWTDRPACVCPVIAAYVRRFNDFLPDERRAKYLTPDLLIRLIGTRGDTASMVARAKVAAESATASAAKYGEAAAKYAEFATESAAKATAEYIESPAEYAGEYAGESAEASAKFAAEASAEAAEKIYRDCINTIEKMIVAGPHSPAEPKYSLAEIAPLFGGFIVGEEAIKRG